MKKICNSCKQSLPFSDFHKRKDSKDERGYECKKCIKQKSHNYYLKNKKRIKEKINQYRKKFPEKRKNMEKERYMRERLIVLTHYSGGVPKCACCGETDIKFLTIDHTHNDGAKQRKKYWTSRGSNLIRWLIKNDFPEVFQVLCYNCNCGRAFNNGICPHKEEILNKKALY